MSEQERYPLTLDHVKQFLATKNDDDELGICHHAMYCLLSETLNWLYPEQKPWRVDIGTYDGIATGRLDFEDNSLRLEKKVDFLRSAFDFSAYNTTPVTKWQLRKRLEFLASKQESLVEECRMPFAVADLFPEEVAL